MDGVVNREGLQINMAFKWYSHFSLETTLIRKIQAAGWTKDKLTSAITGLIGACTYLVMPYCELNRKLHSSMVKLVYLSCSIIQDTRPHSAE